MMSESKYQHKLILTTLLFLFLLSTIGKVSKFAVDDSKVYQEEVNDDDEYRRAGHDGDQVQLSRRAQVVRSCMWRAGHGVMRPMNPYFSSKFYPASMTLAEKKGVGWCRIAEVDTAAWSLLFLFVMEVPVIEIRNAVASNNIKRVLKQNLSMRPKKRKSLIEQGNKDFNFLIVVRHPFLRLVDAYRDKIENNLSDSKIQNFAEFVDTLIRTPPNLMDKHWAPYSKVCIPCKISYSTILKLETLDRDLNWLFKKLDIKHYQQDFYNLLVEKTAQKTSESLSRKYFSQTKKMNIRRLYEKYQVDFEMFGYEGQIQKYIDMGHE